MMKFPFLFPLPIRLFSQPFNAQGSTFLLDDQGNINYPVLGKLPLNGLTSREAENLITDRLKSYVKERPTVVVRMSGFKVSVLGGSGLSRCLSGSE